MVTTISPTMLICFYIRLFTCRHSIYSLIIINMTLNISNACKINFIPSSTATAYQARSRSIHFSLVFIQLDSMVFPRNEHYKSNNRKDQHPKQEIKLQCRNQHYHHNQWNSAKYQSKYDIKPWKTAKDQVSVTIHSSS